VPAINSQLPRRLHPSVPPSDQPPICVGCCSSGLPSGPTSNPSSAIDLSAYLPTNLRLAPVLHRPVLPSNPASGFHRLPCPPAFPSDRPPTCVRYRILQFCLPTNFRLIIGYRVSDFAFRSASDLRRRSFFQLCLPTNLPTCAGRYVLGLSL